MMLPDMPDPKQTQQIRNAVDHRLSGLRPDPWLAQRIVADEVEEIRMKKKISAGLIAALALLLICAAGLTESWHALIGKTATTHAPEVTTVPVSPVQESGQREFTLNRQAMEKVFAPVEITVLDEMGEESASFQITAQVAQVEYFYSLILYPDADEWELEEAAPYLYPAPAISDGNMRPFSPFLLAEEKELDGYSVTCEGKDGLYTVSFSGEYTLCYYSRITLNHRGEIVKEETDTVSRSLSLRDENSDLPDSETFFSSLPAAGLQYGETPADAYYDAYCFGAPYIVRYTDETGTPQAMTVDACVNMRAEFMREQFETLPAFGKADGPVDTQGREIIRLSAASAEEDHLYTFRQVEAPDVTVTYRGDGYTVRVTGGKFQVSYPVEMNFGPEAYQQIDGVTWRFTPQLDALRSVNYRIEEYPYQFTFHVMEPLPLSTSQTFGADFPPVTMRYTEPDGTEKTWEWNPGFTAVLQEAAVTPLVDFSQKAQTIPYREEFIRFFGMGVGGTDEFFKVLEPPDLAVTPQMNGYTVRVTGGLLRVRYNREIWRRENEDGRIETLLPPTGEDRYTVEAPFDFTFTVPVYTDPPDEG